MQIHYIFYHLCETSNQVNYICACTVKRQFFFLSEVNRRKREADHSTPSNTEFKNVRSYNSGPLYAFTAWCVMSKGQFRRFINFD